MSAVPSKLSYAGATQGASAAAPHSYTRPVVTASDYFTDQMRAMVGLADGLCKVASRNAVHHELESLEKEKER